MGSAVKNIVSNPLNAVANVATFGQVGYENGKLGMGEGTKLVDKATGGAISKLGGALLGEETPATADQTIDLASPQGRALQEQALGMYGQELGRDTSQIAANQIAGQEAQARQGAADQEMRARQMVAQRGLGGSASGINAILGQQANLGKEIGDIRAQAPGLAQQMRQQQLGFASQGVNQILNEQGQSKVLKMGQAAGPRQGGLLPILGGIGGAMLGGPGGAQAGMGLGQAATQIR